PGRPVARGGPEVLCPPGFDQELGEGSAVGGDDLVRHAHSPPSKRPGEHTPRRSGPRAAARSIRVIGVSFPLSADPGVGRDGSTAGTATNGRYSSDSRPGGSG